MVRAETAESRSIFCRKAVIGQRSNRLAAGQSKGEGLQELTGGYGSHSPQESPRAIGNSHRSAIERVTFSTSLCAISQRSRDDAARVTLCEQRELV